MKSAARVHVVFVDSNIPMYLVGGDHPNRATATQLVSNAAVAGHKLVTDAEVLQEILHRYVAIGRRDAIDPAFSLTLGIVDDVLPIELVDVDVARDLVRTFGSLSARDAIHLALMRRHDVSHIMTFDSDFDGIPGITRLPPP